MELSRLAMAAKNPLVSEYINNQDMSFFHYSFLSEEDDRKRYNDLMTRNFPRKPLSDHIRNFMEPLGLTKEIEKSLEKLEQSNSVVVIGGQQAGLLMGPLYSIHKMLSIIFLAREKEKSLGVPVVPVFWIAGEDHDIYEVNHVFTVKDNQMKKSVFRQKLASDKQMISKVEFDQHDLKEWCKKIIASFGETDYTNQILDFLNNAVQYSRTYTDFFAYITNQLFNKYGLLLVDSAHPELRKIETPFFQKMINNGQEITKALFHQQQQIKAKGFQPVIESLTNGFQLFYENEGERILLRFGSENNQIYGTGISFTKEELLALVEKYPEKFSNNVVTRPVMQELLFPSIAFIAGPGEIAYWAELKSVFELLDLKMPLIVPRLNITLLERNIEDDLREIEIPIDSAIIDGVTQAKNEKIHSLKDQKLEDFIHQTCHEIEQKYFEAANRIVEFDKGLEVICRKNSDIVQAQLQYLQSKVEESVKRKHDALLSKYDRIDLFLHPENGLQERCWNVFYFVNKYGFNLIDNLLSLDYQCNGDHYIVKI